MSSTPATRYGRVSFDNIGDLLDRLRQVSAIFPEDSDFSAYLTTHDNQRYYGLDYGELEEVYLGNKENVQSISTSCTDQEGRSVRVNFRFSEKNAKADGQFVISTNSSFQSKTIEQMLNGNWQELSFEEEFKRFEISNLLSLLTDIKGEEARIAAEAREQAEVRKAKLEAEAEAQARAQAQKRSKAKPKPSRRSNRNVRNIPISEPNEIEETASTLSSIRDRFEFEKGMSVNILIHLLEQISQTFLNNAPFNIRLITTDGEPFTDIGIQGLQRFFEKRRAKVLRLYMDAATKKGELVDIALDLDPKSRRNQAEIEITSNRAKEIQAMIRHILENTVAYTAPGATMVHEMFRFDDAQFKLDKVIHLLSAVSTKYLQRATPTAFLSTTQGRTYPALSLRQLRTVFSQHTHEVSFLLFGMNQARTGQTFSLMFQFHTPGHEAYGSLSMMWSNHEMHTLVKQLIWTQLKLKPYRKQEGKTSAQRKQEVSKKHLLVNPSFKNRDFHLQPMTSLIIMPLEAYWSQPLWQHLNKVLGSMGYDTTQASPLFQQNVIENSWTRMNEVDLIIADLTYKHPDVFYKTGIAHTLGKNIIVLSQHARDIPPDFHQFPSIIYDNNLPGLERLSLELTEIIKSFS
ncbi:MAG: hypothetical protein AAFN10_10930 [Bacteroidota bacterium]